MTNEEQNPENFEQKFREKFDDWEVTPPDWIDFQAVIPQKETKSKRAYRFWWWSLPLLLLSTTGTYLASLYLPTRTAFTHEKITNTPENKHNTQDKSSETPATGQARFNKVLPTPSIHNNPNFDSIQRQFTRNPNVDSIQRQFTRNLNVDSIQRQFTRNPNIDSIQKQFTSNPNIDSTQRQSTSNPNIDSIQKQLIAHTQINKNFIAFNLSMRDSLHIQVGKYEPIFDKKLDSIQTPPFKTLGKWWLHTYIAQNNTYKIVNPNRQDNILIKYFQADRGFTVLNRGIELGVRLERELTNKWHIFGGLAYQKNQLQTNHLYHEKSSNIKIDSVINFQKVYFTALVQDSLKKQTLNYELLNVELGGSYHLKWRRFESALYWGGSYQYIHTLHFKQENQRIQTSYRSHQFGVRGGLQFSYVFSSRKQFFVEPTLAYQFTPIFRGGMYDLNTYQAGLRLGMKWRL